jgi:hypothetical protein
MPNSSRDPIQAIKDFLGQAQSPSTDRAALTALAPDFREIHTRLARARRTDDRVGLSQALESLVLGTLQLPLP